MRGGKKGRGEGIGRVDGKGGRGEGIGRVDGKGEKKEEEKE